MVIQLGALATTETAHQTHSHGTPKGSWLCLEHQADHTAPQPEMHDSLEDIWDSYDDGHEIERLCIDIPIGLPTGPNERAVDKRCRSHLDRTSTVFRVPVRDALVPRMGRGGFEPRSDVLAPLRATSLVRIRRNHTLRHTPRFARR